MDVEASPSLSPDDRQVVREALVRTGVRIDGRPDGYASVWRIAGLLEAVSNEPGAASYALSPRSTRGATRA